MIIFHLFHADILRKVCIFADKSVNTARTHLLIIKYFYPSRYNKNSSSWVLESLLLLKKKN